MSRKLDVSAASIEKKAEILKYAAETRRFEIERFWQRSLFFWGFIGAAFIAYAALAKDKPADPLLPFIVACFGVVSSVAWTLQNRGSKYWQEAWEDKIKAVEFDVLGAEVFSNIEPVRNRHIWGAARYSVSKLAVALSDFTLLVWLVLAWRSYPVSPAVTCLSLPILIAGATGLYTVLLFVLGHSKPYRY